MPLKLKCPKCGKSLTAPDSLMGKSAPCPGCGTTINVSAPPPAPVPSSEPILEPEPVPTQGVDSDSGEIPFADEPVRPRMPMAPPAPPPVPAPGTAGDNQPRRPCPRCGEMIPIRAMKCRFCGAIFDPNLQKIEYAKSKSADPADDDLTGGEWVLAILCSTIGCIMGIVWMLQGKPKGKKMFLVSLIASFVWGVIRFMAQTSGR